MTEQLSTLLRTEAAGLDIPPAPAARVLATGRRLRRRRRTTAAAIGAVAAVVLVAAGIAVLSGRDDRTPEPVRPQDEAAYQELGAWADGDQVHIGNHVVTVPGAMDLRYTSVGVVVSSLDDTQTLVRPNGTTQTLDLELPGGDDAIPSAGVATDVDAPYVAYVRDVGDGRGQLTVRDLSTGDETAVGAAFPVDGGGLVQSLWDDQVYYVHGLSARLVDWRSGRRLPLPSAEGFVFQLSGYGHGVLFGIDRGGEEWTVTSRIDGRRLLAVPASSATVSPDGRYVAASAEGGGIDVYAVATGDRVHLGGPRIALDYGWSPDGHLVGRSTSRADAEVEVCDPVEGSCTATGSTAGERPTFVSPGQTVE